jgi:hypothetical protein
VKAGRIFLGLTWRLVCGSVLLGACPGALPAKDQPAWLTRLLAQPSSAQPATVPAVVLLHEQQIVFDDQQEWTETIRFAVRLLAQNSQDHAAFSLYYLNGTDAVKHIAAVLIRPDGYTKEFGEADWADVAVLDEKGLYSDLRVQTIRAGIHGRPGDVFSCEVAIRRRQRHGEMVWMPSAASGLPADLIQVTLKAPKGFEAQLHCMGVPPVFLPEDNAHRGVQRWCWRDRPYEPAEARAPSRPANPVFVKLLRKDGAKTGPGASLADWPGVALLAAQYQDTACNTSPSLTATAKQLTDGLVTPLAKLEAVGRFVQQCPYAALDKNTGFGFGFQPRLASKVLATRYGDCKDKVNLLRALLREIGVTAYPVAVSAETPSEIDPGWPSLLQFNHMIAAIAVAPECDFPAVAELSGVGRVLFFDPTSEQTPLGFLPWNLQDSQGLLCDPRGPGLVRLPKLAESTRWRVHREVELTLRENGLEGSATVELQGELAEGFRQALRQFKDSELREKLTGMFTHNARGLTLTDHTFADNWAQDLVTLKLRFRALEFGQKMTGRLWVLRLNLFAPMGIPEISDRERRQPYVVTPVASDEVTVLKWPGEYSPESVPAAAAVQGPYGEYRVGFQVHDGAITCDRHFAIKGTTLTPAQYLEFRQFLLTVAKQDQRTLVLKKPAE